MDVSSLGVCLDGDALLVSLVEIVKYLNFKPQTQSGSHPETGEQA